MRRYKLEVTTPDCDVIECGETIADTQDEARDVAFERYQSLCTAGHAPFVKRDRLNIDAREMIAAPRQQRGAA